MTTFANLISQKLLGKKIEVYCGDVRSERAYSDYTLACKEIIVGKLIEAEGECLSVEVNFNGKSKIVYLNAWNIKSICECSGDSAPILPQIFTEEHINLRNK